MGNRSIIQYLILMLKGMAMGAADVVPGVSGGTIAFISGIYEELIDNISNISINSFKIWFEKGFKTFWTQINGTFFLFLFSGIGISVFSLAKFVAYLLAEFPILVWSFFFGLIISSVWLIFKVIEKWSLTLFFMTAVGAAFAYYLTRVDTIGFIDSEWYIILSGAIAICAMILPGISGAFILIILGTYDKVLNAIGDKNFLIISLFAFGCLFGLFSFARLLKYLFSNFKSYTIAVLIGFMVGSLNKVWPWKETIIKSKEKIVQYNILPSDFSGESYILSASLLFLFGFFVIIIFDKFSPNHIKK